MFNPKEPKTKRLAESLNVQIEEMSEIEILSGHSCILREINHSSVFLHGPVYSYKKLKKISNSYGLSKKQCIKLDYTYEEHLKKICELERVKRAVFIVGVGGGSIQDAAKYVSRFLDKKLVLIPTIVASDGISSPILVVRQSSKSSASKLGKLPDGIILCWDWLLRQPEVFWQALVGDIISNLVAVRDWEKFSSKQSDCQFRDHDYKFSSRVAEKAAITVLNHPKRNFENHNFLQSLILAALECGWAMKIAGTSHTCSGSEHLISHAIDCLHEGPLRPHGIQVGAAVPACLELHNAYLLKSEVVKLYEDLGIPTNIKYLGPFVGKNLKDILLLAPTVRGSRPSVISSIEHNDILHFFKMYQ